MELAFHKPNLTMILLTVYKHRRDGLFLTSLFEAIDESQKQKRKTDEPMAPSRATWFNYFGDLNKAYPDGLPDQPLARVAHDFVQKHPKTADKFFRKFTPTTFLQMHNFLFARGYLGSQSLAEGLAGVSGSLYFSLVEFLKPKIEPAGDHLSLPGVYRIYRPSLSVPGRILVSAARISSKEDGSLHYAERMHFYTGFGWRQQHLEGYIIGIEGKAYLLTKDDNTKLMQFSVLKPLVRKPSGNGSTHQIHILAGSYSGASMHRDSGLFSTGIIMVRDDLRSLEKYPVTRWKIGHLGPFGLQRREDVPDQLLRYLYE